MKKKKKIGPFWVLIYPGGGGGEIVRHGHKKIFKVLL